VKSYHESYRNFILTILVMCVILAFCASNSDAAALGWSNSQTDVDFGNLYLERYWVGDEVEMNESAYRYNHGKKKRISFKNSGDTDVTWTLKGPYWVIIPERRGTLGPNGYESVEIWTSLGNDTGEYTGTITLESSNGGGTLSVRAFIYDRQPKASLVIPSPGSNNMVNVRVDDSVRFVVSTEAPLMPGATLEEHKWRRPDVGDSFMPKPFPERNYTFKDTDVHTIQHKSVDSNGVESNIFEILVRVWNGPIIKDTPPQSAISAGTVSWYGNKYVGVMGQPVSLMAEASLEGNEKIAEYIWDFDNNWDTVELRQAAGAVVTHTWSTQSLSGRINCKAVTNYGVESKQKVFDLKIYAALEVKSDSESYMGRPNKAVQLKGSINESSYPGYQSIDYQWRVYNNGYIDISTDSDGSAEYAWGITGNESDTYMAQLTATVVTEEGLTLTGSGTTSVIVESGKPTATPGGPYRGGIAGGNFSPIQFEGNHPEFIEAEDIGKIIDWQWFFGDPESRQSGLIGEFYEYPSDLADMNSIENHIQQNHVSPKAVQVFGTVDFPSTQGDFAHRDPIYEPIELLDRFYARFTGFVEIGRPGEYMFFIDADDGFRLRVGGQTVVEMPGLASASGSISFGEAGIYPVELAFFELVGPAYLSLSWIQPMVKSTDPMLAGAVALTTVTRLNSGGLAEGVWNPSHSFGKAGDYTVRLRAQSEFGKWSTAVPTQVEVIDGKISGYVHAADLRTSVREARLTLISSHVDPDALAGIAADDDNLNTTGDDGIWTETDENGYYIFEHIPLGSYRVIASKGTGDDVHEFETPVIATELTLDAPNKQAVDFVDISVFPVGGRIIYSIQKNGTDVLVENVMVKALPLGTTSYIESLLTTKSPRADGTNYGLPLFAGKYLIKAEAGGHDIRIKETGPGYDKKTQLVTIKNAMTDLDFIDYTTRELTVYVEDSGEYPISTYQGNTVKVQVNGENGFAESDNEDGLLDNDLKTEGEVYFKILLPPGKYTVSLPNVPTAIVKGDSPNREAEVDLSVPEPQTVIMVVPVPIELDISPLPRLFDLPDDILADLGIAPEDNPEGFIGYYPLVIQKHTYTIKATANGQPVEGFTLKVRDGVSLLIDEPTPEKIFPDPESDRYAEDQYGNGLYTITTGIPNRTVVNPEEPDTYLEYMLADGKTVVKVPRVLPKQITFSASKDGYEDSQAYTEEVTVLGEVTEGSAAEFVSVPNVNYLVLHDPPGDRSYSYIDDSLTVKAVMTLGFMKIRANDVEIPVYPSPWSAERNISGVDYGKVRDSNQDLGNSGLLDYQDPAISAFGNYMIAAALEGVFGTLVVPTGLGGPVSLVAQAINTAKSVIQIDNAYIQYEVSPKRRLQTNEEDELPDIMGPGKGDLYYGEGWTLALQTKHRLGITKDPDTDQWIPDTAQILTYDIMERQNQYVYTIRDIEKIIDNLEEQIAAIGDPGADQNKKDEKQELQNARNTWVNLLKKNPAYIWHRDYVRTGQADRVNLESFMAGKVGDRKRELLIFSGGGPSFEYSRVIAESSFQEFSIGIGVETAAEFHSTFDIGPSDDIETNPFGGPGIKLELSLGFGAAVGYTTGVGYGGSWESGQGVEQAVGFVLSDNDVGDNISTYVTEGPWGTPIFFTDPGSVTSSPWHPGTNKAVDFTLSLVEEPDNIGPFDYHEGAHYKVNVNYVGQRVLQTATVDAVIYTYPFLNQSNIVSRFNGDAGDFGLYFEKTSPTIPVTVSLYPPAIDMDSSAEKEYSVGIEVDFVEDPSQINRVLTLTPSFADLRAPRATVAAPYDGQRISPAVFAGDKKFKIEVFSDDQDLSKIQLEIRAKRTDGVWEPWRLLSGMVWEAGVANDLITVITHSARSPVRRELTFDWDGSEIAGLGVGEYAFRAVASDKATRLTQDGSQELTPNVDLDAPVVAFRVDGSKPTVLTTMPDYQATEMERIYRGELSVNFNDDMRADDFTDRTFYVTDLLNNSEKVAGFVSYSPALRKAVFVSIVPFQPNGFFRVEIKTDEENPDKTIEKGVHDLAGNPLDNALAWTFRTTDSPFEETWSIVLSASDGSATDANNIAAVEYGTMDGEDARDARAVPKLSSQFDLSFLDRDQVKYDRDIRPADGRLGHHWFFAISNPGGPVTIMYQPSIKLARGPALRQYKSLWLTEFDANGDVSNTIALKPEDAEFNPNTGGYDPVVAYSYTPGGGEDARHFRLDVQKAGFVATELVAGTSGWKFLSVPIKPDRADPFVNLGDDIDQFKLYKYDTGLSGYKIYPLDVGEVALQTGHGYFTRLEKSVEADVGGSANGDDIEIELADAGWHAIGNPFVKQVNVADLQIDGQAFNQAVSGGLVEGTLYRWNADPGSSDAYEAVDNSGQIFPWEGYWLKTESDGLVLTIPVPDGLGSYIAPLPPSYDPPMAPARGSLADTGHLRGFSLRLALTSDSSADLITTLGTKSGARLGFDSGDQSEPPTLGGTVSAYFDHEDWEAEPGLYNTDYQPPLEIGESHTWEFVVYTDEPGAKMELSWEAAIGQIPGDIMLTFRQVDGGSDWQDARKVRSVKLDTGRFITKVSFEMRAERFAMTQPGDLTVVAGEEKITISWTADENPFITGYTVFRSAGNADSENLSSYRELGPHSSHFTDEGVVEEMAYTYQLITRFRTGAELRSELFAVTVLPMIKGTVLLQNYPNPFNPETWLPYELVEEVPVSIHISNLTGQLVRVLDLGVQPRGRYTSKEKAAYWDGENEAGESVASGIYFYSIRCGDYSAIRKMVITR